MKHNLQSQDETQDSRELSSEGKLTLEIISEMTKKQLDFLDESGKSIIERIGAFLAILFAVLVFSNNSPPVYLRGNLPAKIMVIVTLLLYLLAMAAAMLTIQPRTYEVEKNNVSRMSKRLKQMIRYKMRYLRLAGVFFALGSAALAVLIIFLIWMV